MAETSGFAFDHLHLRSLDPDAAGAFYVEHLGAILVGKTETPDQYRVRLTMGGIPVFIDRVAAGTNPPASAPHLGTEHSGLTVPDLDAIAAQLKAAGVVFTRGPEQLGPGLRIAFIKGPDDTLIELLQRG